MRAGFLRTKQRTLVKSEKVREFRLRRIFARSPLVSKLPDGFTANANPIRAIRKNTILRANKATPYALSAREWVRAQSASPKQ